MTNLPTYARRNQKGQALLLVLMVMSLVLTLVLSSVSKSVTDVEISQYEDKSIRAFDAAQAGIEKTVIGSAVPGTPVTLGNGAIYTPSVSAATSPGNFYKVPLNLKSGETATIFFVDHVLSGGDYVMDCPAPGCNTPTSLRICWGNVGATEVPAVHLEFHYSTDSSNPPLWENMADLSKIAVATMSFDANYSTRGNGFAVPSGFGGGIPCTNPAIYAYSTRFDIPVPNLLFMKITMLYNTQTPQQLAVRSTGSLPSQGINISSVGISDDVTRRLQLFQGYPELPFEIGNALYSKGAITK